jgi:hypothetical protein
VAEKPVEGLPESAVADGTCASDERSALMAALMELPPKQRAVVVLRYWGGLTETQATAILGCSVGNVKSQGSRALAKLRTSAQLQDGSLSAVAVSGLSVAAVLAVSVPLAARGVGGSAPSAGGRHSVVVDPPHTDAKGVLTFSGSVDGKAWSVSPEQSGGMKDCLMTLGDCPDGFPAQTHPIGFVTSNGPGIYDSYIADFRSDVASLDVLLADGSQLTLRPALIGSHHLAVFMLPHGYRADRAVAHTTAGDQVSIPFHDPDGLNDFVAWYAPSAVPYQAQVSGQVASGVAKNVVNGKDETWTVTAYVGTFGICIEHQVNGAGGATCYAPQVHPPAALPFTKARGNGPYYTIDTEVDPSVDHINVTFLDNTQVTLTPTRVRGHAFVAIAVPTGAEIVSAVSVGRDGAVLANPDGVVPTKP